MRRNLTKTGWKAVVTVRRETFKFWCRSGIRGWMKWMNVLMKWNQAYLAKLVSIRVCNLVWLDLIKGVCWAFVEVFTQRGAILVLSVPLSFQLCCWCSIISPPCPQPLAQIYRSTAVAGCLWLSLTPYGPLCVSGCVTLVSSQPPSDLQIQTRPGLSLPNHNFFFFF